MCELAEIIKTKTFIITWTPVDVPQRDSASFITFSPQGLWKVNRKWVILAYQPSLATKDTRMFLS